MLQYYNTDTLSGTDCHCIIISSDATACSSLKHIPVAVHSVTCLPTAVSI